MHAIKYILSFLFSLQLLIVCEANCTIKNNSTENSITTTSHSLIAPEGTRYQWYINTLKIEGATKQELKVNHAGIYKLEMTDLHGNVFETQTIIGLTAAGAIIHIFTIGDSTVQDYTAGYYPRKGWGQVLPVFFNTANVTVINKAVGGTSSKSFYNNYWSAVRDNLQTGDFVFIQFGINDRNNADPARYTPTGGEFESYLTKYVNETKAKGAFPVLVTTVRRNAWNTDGTVYDAYHDHPIATRTVAQSLGVPLIDLDAKAKILLESLGETYATRLLYNNYLAGEYPNYPNGNDDNVHFQEMGAIEMAKLVAQGIRDLSKDANVSKLIPFLKTEYQIAVAVNPFGADSVTTHTTTYPQGLTITLKTIPKNTSTFQKWNNAAGTQLSTALFTTVTSGTAAASYTAVYKGATACSAGISAPVTSFCAGSSVILTATAGSTYKWFNGTTQVGTTATYTATAAGSYTVEVTNTSGCKATSAVKTITVNPLPVITSYVKVDGGAWLTAATASVCESSTVNLGPQPNVAAGWSWTGPNNFTSTLRNPVLTGVTSATAGNYISTYTDANGCKATNTFSLLVSKPTASIIASATSFCSGSSVKLTASTGSSYKWFNGTNQIGTVATYTATAAGSYTVEVTNASGCKATSAAKIITVNAVPIATITAPATSFCAGGSVTLTASTGSSYKWFNGTNQVGTAAAYTVTDAGQYTVEVTNGAGCKATSAAKIITVNAVPIATITAPATSFCAGGSVTLTASTGTTYKWFNGINQVGTAASYTATAAGSYTVEVTNNSGCKATSAAKIITVNAVPIATITAPVTSFCAGGSVTLTASTGSSYKWFNGTALVGTGDTYTATDIGSYSVEVTNNAGCKATSAPTLITQAAIQSIPTITTATNTICSNSTALLTASTGSSYKWFSGTTEVGTNATYIATAAGSYTVEITNTAGCKATSFPTEIIQTQPKVWYADIDGDGLGDPTVSLTVCWQPRGYVDVAGDLCPSSTDNNCLDCAGMANGTAYLDNCSVCVGGNTGKTACVSTTTINGTSANILVTPQPFDNTTTISAKNLGMIQSITTISTSGAIVDYRQGIAAEEINIGQDLATGLYSVIIITDKGIFTTKVMKK